MATLSDIFIGCGKDYLNKYSRKILPTHKKAVHDIILCRTPEMGGQVYACECCKKYFYSYHSCGNRNCNKCQNNKADEWLEKKNELLLPVNYFMVTFTLPEELRAFARSSQILFYNLLFKSSSGSIHKLSTNKKYIGGDPGYLGVLHTWSRKLDYHPHIHYIITGGGLNTQQNKWIKSNDKFLFPVKALSVIFKAKFRDGLKKKNPLIFNQIPPEVWKREWIVNSIPVGSGSHAMKYLAQYIFRAAISNNRIIKWEGGFVTFKYKDSKTKLWKNMKLNDEEFIRRFLQHVLPKGFVKVRYFGVFASRNHSLLKKAKQILPQPVVKKPKQKPQKPKPNSILCGECGKEMKLILITKRRSYYNKAPPNNNFPPLENNKKLMPVN